MGNPTDLRKGSVIMLNGKPHVVMSVMHRTPGRRLGFVQTVARNLENNMSTAIKFKSTDNVDFCQTTMCNLEFSYIDGSDYHFINPTTFDDVAIPASVIGDDARWLVEGVQYTVLNVDGQPVSVQMPLSIDLKVVEASDGLKGDSATSATKPVKLENGLVVNVPLFIKKADVVKIRTEDASYVSRA